MAQSGFTPIKLYLSTTAAAVPLAADLAPGELAINNNDGKLFYEDSSGVVQVIATKAGASGDVVGPASSTANAVPSFNGTTGKLIQDNSGVTIAAGVLTATGVSAAQVDITAQGDLRLQDSTGGEYVALQAPSTIATSYTLTLPVDDGTAGQALITDGSGVLSWSTAASGDVYGPASATDNAVARFDLTTGKLIQNSVVTIDDTGNVAGVGTLSASGQLTLTNASDYNLYASGAGKNFMLGALGIGSVPAAATITLQGSAFATGAVTVNNILVNSSIQSDVTNLYSSYVSNPTTAATAFTLSTIRHFSATQQTFGVGSTVTNQYGFIANSALTGATNNYGFYGNIASGTGRYNFYAAGTADNYFAGNVGIGRAPPTVALDIFTATPQIKLQGTGTSSEVRVIPNYGNADLGAIGTVGGSPFMLYTFNTERMRIGSTGTISLGADPGSESLRVTPVASAVNYLNVSGAATTGFPSIVVAGSDTNIGIVVQTKGTGQLVTQTNSFQFQNTSGALQFFIPSTASSVNYLQATGGTTGNAPTFSSQGSDTNIGLVLSAKGTGSQLFTTGGGTQFAVANTASAVNYFQVTGGTTTNDVTLRFTGSDTNVGGIYAAKGTGSHRFFTNDNNQQQFNIAHTASAVNYLQASGGATTGGPSLLSTGSDTNVDFLLKTKGTGTLNFYTNSSTLQFTVSHTASSVNFLYVTGGATGGSPTVAVAGSDTNIDLTLTPKGTGNVRFGTHTANADAPITGYITIKDAGGTTRKLAIIA